VTRTKILKRLATYVPIVLSGTTKPGPHCVLSSAIGQMVLARFGIQADPFVAEVMICNEAWVHWAEDDFVGGRDAQEARGAYMITNRPGPDVSLPSLNPVTGPAWDGHLALRVDDRLVDLDLGNFARPTKNIYLPPAFVAPFRADNQVIGECHMHGHVTVVHYKPLVAPYADDYLTSKDWTMRDRYAEEVSVLATAIRKGLS
jgi:hypothetical protein